MKQSFFSQFSTRFLLGVLILVTPIVKAETDAHQSFNPVASENFDTEQYKVGPGDLIKITIFNQEELSGEYLINGAGQIALPLIGDINARD